MKTEKLKIYSLDELVDEYIGPEGTSKRDDFEYELQLDILGEAIKQARKKRNLTQSELGSMIGVQKAQISKIENSMHSARLETILKVFKALNARINFHVELLEAEGTTS